MVVTPLYNYVMPLIRYELDDYATVAPPCPCGRKHLTLERIAGRVRNLAYSPTGEAFWPVGLGMPDGVLAVTKCQFVQTALDSIDVRLVLTQPLTVEEEELIRARVLRALGHPYTLNLVPVAEVERSPAGKFEQFVAMPQVGG